MEDQILLKELQNKDSEEQGFQKIYEKYGRLVLYVAKQFSLSEELCEELVHDVFLRMYQKRSSLNQGEKLKGWLCITTRNLAIDLKRKNRKEMLIKTTVEKNIAKPMLNPQVVHNVECQAISQLIEQLTAETGDDSLKLFYVDGLKAKEIAEAKGLEVSTVTTHLSRLRRKFKDRIKEKIESIREAAK